MSGTGALGLAGPGLEQAGEIGEDGGEVDHG
jgi:hypothetical protein